MCRLFGFRTVLTSQIHNSLTQADNALADQSNRHPDGWGVAYYIANAPHLVKSVNTAIDDQLFKKVSGIVTSQTIVAHLRKATVGDSNYTNTHPFQHGKWVFAHNGNIKDFAKHRPALEAMLDPDLGKYILGQTDSEFFFYLLLSFMLKNGPIHTESPDYEAIRASIKECISYMVKIIGPYHKHDSGPSHETFLTFLLSDGKLMFGFQAGKTLHYSTHKTLCPLSDTCTHYNPSCEAPTEKGSVNHLLFSSEPIAGENIWTKMQCGELISINSHMELDRMIIKAVRN